MIPKFNGGGNLPEGIHNAIWDEIRERYGNNDHRRELLGGLRIALDFLKKAGCKEVYIDGSFVTSKRYPNDYDCLWDTTGVDHTKLPDFFSPKKRKIQKFLLKGEFIPSNVIEKNSRTPFLDFYQTDKVTMERKGIIKLKLEDFP